MATYRSQIWFASLGLALSACGVPSQNSTTKEEWNETNAPTRLQAEFETRLDSLPVGGAQEKVPWTDTYWPDRDGGLAYRWQIGQDAALVRLMTLAELRAAARITLDTLSPAEKYDILLGRYDYPFTKKEISRTRITRPIWYGLCHGWAPASTHFEEPGTVQTSNVDGINLTFTSSDIKGLLSLAQQDRYVSSVVRVLGARCRENLIRNPQARELPECKDVNAGSFHIALTNIVGLAQESLLVDLDPGAVVWNHPVYRFNSTILQRRLPTYSGAAPGTVETTRVRTTIHYIKPRGPSREPVGQVDIGQFGERTYEYLLDVNSEGQIIGGRFEGLDRPDFLWTQAPPFLVRDFEPLSHLYQASIAAQPYLKVSQRWQTEGGTYTEF